MTDAIQKVQALPTIGTLEFSTDQRKMIRDSFLSGASDAEASVMLEVARLRRLNPLTGQIHFVKRWNSDRNCFVWAYQVAIDGFRAIAQRTGLYDGQDEPEFEYNKDGSIQLCRVRVFRRDWARPSVGVAWFAEYAQKKKDGKLTMMWEQKPHIMAAKCAEALAFRKAFPEDMSGLYAPEELGDDDAQLAPSKVVIHVASRTDEVKGLLKAQANVSPSVIVDVGPNETEAEALARSPLGRIKALGEKHGKTGEAMMSFLKGATNKTGNRATLEKTLTDADVLAVDAAFKALVPAEPEPKRDEPHDPLTGELAF